MRPTAKSKLWKGAATNSGRVGWPKITAHVLALSDRPGSVLPAV
jgi:hypothetical protein